MLHNVRVSYARNVAELVNTIVVYSNYFKCLDSMSINYKPE